MKKRLILGIFALAGGYFGKKYLDKQMANSNNFYDDYKDALFGEGGKIILKGLKGSAEGLSKGYEKLLKKPKFSDELDEEAFLRKVRARQETCPHLKGRELAPNLAKNEAFAHSKLSREEFFGAFDDAMQESELEKAQNEAKKLSKLLDDIYALESECFKTSEKIEKLCAQMAKFRGFEPPLLKYSTIDGKYEPNIELSSPLCLTPFSHLFAQDEPICAAKAHLSKAQKRLDEGIAWLDELLKAEFNALSNEEQEKIYALAKEAREFHAFISGAFVHFSGFWIDTKYLIERASVNGKENAVSAEFETENSSNG